MDGSLAAKHSQKEIRLADYRAPAFLVTSIELVFSVLEGRVLVSAKSCFEKKASAERDLCLDGSPYFQLNKVLVDGVELSDTDFEVGNESLTIKGVPDRFSVEIETELRPKDNTRLEGLYASGGNLCTQCEAEGFRHITYFLDRPDVLTTYTVRIEADKQQYPVLLSNGNLLETGDLEEGRHFATWFDPHRKPCYLFALVAGKLVALSDKFVTRSGRSVDLNIYVREPDLHKCDHAMQSLKRSMKWDEDVYGLEYDLDIYNIVAVSDFNMGAMENKGLNIFNTKYVLASPETATDTDFDNVEGVIGHEYFHNWTGNRVTCRDWFQLSLKEGLTVFRDQEFSADMGSRAVKRIQDVRTLRLLQFPEDAGPLAHPVRPESYVEINNFYTTTIYNKGAEVIRMMERVLGHDAFNKGVSHYLTTQDGCAATCEDFVQSMEHVSGVDLQQFRRWYSQAGTPTLTCKRAWKDGNMVLTISQSVPDTPGQKDKEPMQIPFGIAWLDASGEVVQTGSKPAFVPAGDTIYLNLSKTEQKFEFANCPQDAVPSLLRGFSAPVNLESDLSNDERLILFRYDTDSYARWQAGQELFTAEILGQLSEDTNQSDPAVLGNELSKVVASIVEDEQLDPAYAAELLSVPSEVALGQQQAVLDPVGIHRVRSSFLADIVDQNWSTIRGRFDALFDAGTSGPERRKLKNSLLELISYSNTYRETAGELVASAFDKASNMTDQFAALSILCSGTFDIKQDGLERFYSQWKEHDLVIDKWFAVQAQSPDTDAVVAIKRLTQHPAFSYKNPNRLRSLISMFALSNQLNFHADDGSGYNLLSEVIALVDPINPQTAARMLSPLGRWGRLDSGRQELMRRSLEKLLSLPELSNDVRELAEKSLRPVL